MSPRPSTSRRLAVILMQHAARVLPEAHSPWGDAMRNELDHIESDRQALTWAFGCLIAGYVERVNSVSVIHKWYTRIFLALLIGTQVLAFLFATVLTAAYRTGHLQVASFMGSFTPGDDYHRFIPLMDATPWWIHVMWVSASVLFFACAWQLFRQRRAAFLLFAIAWILGTAGNLIGQTLPEYRQTFSFSTPLFTRDYLVPAATALLPVLIAAAVWVHGRCLMAEGISE